MRKLCYGATLLLLLLGCGLFRQNPQPTPALDPLVFEVQTATPTFTPIVFLSDAPTATPDPNATATPLITATLTVSETFTPVPSPTIAPLSAPTASPLPPPATPSPAPTAPSAEPLRGGVWDFEDGFTVWQNPYGDVCPGSGLANGWTAFTSRDQYGSACFNETVWQDNVYSGQSAQEITFAYVGIQAGIFRSVPTVPGHRYTVVAHMRREFSPATVEVALGLDVTGSTDWQAETVQWFPWDENLDDAWAKTETTITASGAKMTLFIKGNHPYPEPGGALRLDAITITDIGPE